MQTFIKNYINICELYLFSRSAEFGKYSLGCQLLIIQIASRISDAGELGKIVADIRAVFPKAQVTSNFSNTKNSPEIENNTCLYFTFLEKADYGIADETNKNFSAISDLDKCKSAEIEILYNQLKEKNKLIEVYNHQINESLAYAGKLQKAVIPPKEYFNKIFPEHFIIYKPKHFVSGDFFWLCEKGNKLYFAVADCTGHGVPGALMSILGISLLNEISNIFTSWNNISASDVLNLLRKMLKTSLHQNGKSEELKDGMDIALCVLDKESLHLQFAGAYIPLYIVRNNELIESKGNPMPIGVYLRDESLFEQSTFQLQRDDMLYLASDGYEDQFGGSDYKKFKSKNFKNLLISVSSNKIEEQKQVLKNTLELWQNGHEQIDDITVLGIRIGKEPLINYSI
jgi:serine phosphatase RsbU (regulator of sigma subunit)